MLWIKALYVIFMVTWFAGLFYLPRLFVYHAQANASDSVHRETLKTMERKLLAIMSIGAVLTLVFGLLLLVVWLPGLLQLSWMRWKLALVALLIAYHVWCARIVRSFHDDRNLRSHVWYRWFNEVPALFLVAIVILVIVRPAG